MSTAILLGIFLSGVVFGLAVGILAGTILHFCLGLGLLLFPRTARGLLKQSLRAEISQATWLRVGLGVLTMAFALGIAYFIVLPALQQVWYFNPLFETLVFLGIGLIWYLQYWHRVVKNGQLNIHRARFGSSPEM